MARGDCVHAPPSPTLARARPLAPMPFTKSSSLSDSAREKLAAESELAYLSGRAARADRSAYLGVLDRVPPAAPDPGDER